MEFLLIIVVALLAIIAVVVIFNFLGNRRARQAEADALRNRTYRPGGDPFSSADDDSVYGDPRQLKPGDLVELRGETYAVRGTLRLTQDGYTWTENFLDTGLGTKAWISVEDDPDLEVVLWHELSGVVSEPGPDTVEVDGRRYHSEEAGNARFTSAGTTGSRHPAGWPTTTIRPARTACPSRTTAAGGNARAANSSPGPITGSSPSNPHRSDHLSDEGLRDTCQNSPANSVRPSLDSPPSRTPTRVPLSSASRSTPPLQEPLPGRTGEIDGITVSVRLLGASHQVVVDDGAQRICETVACLPEVTSALPKSLQDSGYLFSSRIERADDDRLAALVEQLGVRVTEQMAAGGNPSVMGVFPGDPPRGDRHRLRPVGGLDLVAHLAHLPAGR